MPLEPADALVLLTLIALEAVLSLDNVAALGALARRVPPAQRGRLLRYGLLGAYALRVGAILLVSAIAQNRWLRLLGGAYLVYLVVAHLVLHRAHAAEDAPAGLLERAGVPTFWALAATVALTDVAFALDQVLAGAAMSDEPALLLVASLAGLGFVRVGAAFFARIVDRFPAVARLAYSALGFVGLKLVAVEGAHALGFPGFEVPKAISLGVTLGLLVAPFALKLLLDGIRRSARSA